MGFVMSRVWIIGPLAWDTILHIPQIPPAGEFVQGHGLHGRPGGTAANVAVGLASAGVETGFAGYVGEDELGLKLLRSLEESAIQELHIQTLPGDSNNVLLLINESGERTIIGLTEDRLDQVSIQDVDLSADDFVVFVLWRPHFLGDLEYAKKNGCTVIVGIEALKSIPQISADICIGSGSDITAELDIASCLTRFGRIVITHGVDGADQYWEEGGEIRKIHQPAIKVDKVIDTTGAGDSFLAGYIKGLIDPVPANDAPLLIGAHWSAVAVTSHQSTAPDWADVVKQLPREYR